MTDPIIENAWLRAENMRLRKALDGIKVIEHATRTDAVHHIDDDAVTPGTFQIYPSGHAQVDGKAEPHAWRFVGANGEKMALGGEPFAGRSNGRRAILDLVHAIPGADIVYTDS